MKLNLTNYLCENNIVYFTLNKPICGVFLLTEINKSIPSDCDTKILTGKIELWQNLNSNQWLYVLSEPQSLTIS